MCAKWGGARSFNRALYERYFVPLKYQLLNAFEININMYIVQCYKIVSLAYIKMSKNNMSTFYQCLSPKKGQGFRSEIS